MDSFNQPAPQFFPVPATREKYNSERHQARRSTQPVHHAGEEKEQDGQREARHTQIDPLRALFVNAPGDQSRRADDAPEVEPLVDGSLRYPGEYDDPDGGDSIDPELLSPAGVRDSERNEDRARPS